MARTDARVATRQHPPRQHQPVAAGAAEAAAPGPAEAGKAPGADDAKAVQKKVTGAAGNAINSRPDGAHVLRSKGYAVDEATGGAKKALVTGKEAPWQGTIADGAGGNGEDSEDEDLFDENEVDLVSPGALGARRVAAHGVPALAVAQRQPLPSTTLHAPRPGRIVLEVVEQETDARREAEEAAAEEARRREVQAQRRGRRGAVFESEVSAAAPALLVHPPPRGVSAHVDAPPKGAAGPPCNDREEVCLAPPRPRRRGARRRGHEGLATPCRQCAGC